MPIAYLNNIHPKLIAPKELRLNILSLFTHNLNVASTDKNMLKAHTMNS